MTNAEAGNIMSRAREAKASWGALDVSSRCLVLDRLRREIALSCEAIAELVAQETGKPVLDALSGDVLVTLEMLRYYKSQAHKILRTKRVSKPAFFFRGARFQLSFEPHGVALIFGPSNYPLQLAMVPMLTALIAGNAVVLKGSEHTPLTNELIERLCDRAHLPSGLVQVIQEGPVQSALLIDAKPDIIFFTGSSRNGRAVAEHAARHLIPTILELGGKDPALVFADCHLDRAVEGVTYGAFSNTGKVCVGIKRVYVEAPIYEEFLVRLKQRMSNLRISADHDADLCPLPSSAASIVRSQIEDAHAHGAVIEYPDSHEYIGCRPTMLSGVPQDARILTEECFGPVICVAPFRDEAHAVELANGNPFALSSSAWTSDRRRAARVAGQLSAGSCAVNDVIRVIANPHAPFGGNKDSGYGRYHGPDGLHAFSRVKTVMMTSGRSPREINWFPFNKRTRQQLAGLLKFRHASTGILVQMARLLPMALLIAICVVVPGQAVAQTPLTIHVHLLPQAHGSLAYLVFSSSDGFPSDRTKAAHGGFLPIPYGSGGMRFAVDLPPGRYAVAVYDDLNGNHKLDHSLLGIPREPTGASNNPRPRMGPPRFDECAFKLDATAQTIDIRLVQP